MQHVCSEHWEASSGGEQRNRAWAPVEARLPSPHCRADRAGPHGQPNSRGRGAGGGRACRRAAGQPPGSARAAVPTAPTRRCRLLRRPRRRHPQHQPPRPLPLLEPPLTTTFQLLLPPLTASHPATDPRRTRTTPLRRPPPPAARRQRPLPRVHQTCARAAPPARCKGPRPAAAAGRGRRQGGGCGLPSRPPSPGRRPYRLRSGSGCTWRTWRYGAAACGRDSGGWRRGGAMWVGAGWQVVWLAAAEDQGSGGTLCVPGTAVCDEPPLAGLTLPLCACPASPCPPTCAGRPAGRRGAGRRRFRPWP